MNKKKVIIIGGGLWGGLLAYHLNHFRKDLTFEIHEKNSTFGGNHTWSFHGKDIEAETLRFLGPMVRKSWDAYTVAFPEYQKEINLSYHSLASENFHARLMEVLPRESVFLGSQMSFEEAKLRGEIVIDARNLPLQGEFGYQKFIGLEIKLEDSHNLKMPILMDAKVDQLDGFRFLYLLPFNDLELLIEDTRYSNNPLLEDKSIEDDILSYVKDKGWKIAKVIRKERGVLPIPLSELKVSHHKDVIPLNGIFHDVTGYSLPDAIRLIHRMIMVHSWDHKTMLETLDLYKFSVRRQRQYFQLLNRMMFKAAGPLERYKVLQHFYRFPETFISRFYSGEMKSFDYLRLFCGKPPVKVSSAIQCILPDEVKSYESPV